MNKELFPFGYWFQCSIYPLLGVWSLPGLNNLGVAANRPSTIAMTHDVDLGQGRGDELGGALENALTRGPGRSIMAVTFDTPDGFQPTSHVSLDGTASEAWTGILRELKDGR